MARKGRFRIRRRRGTLRRARPHKDGIRKAIKVGIATLPVGLFAYNSYNAAGGGSAGALQAGRTVVSAYSGYDIVNNKFAPQALTLGYVPMAGAYLFGKAWSRFMR